jgi:hypothetical protein
VLNLLSVFCWGHELLLPSLALTPQCTNKVSLFPGVYTMGKLKLQLKAAL